MNKLNKEHLKEANGLNITNPYDQIGMLKPLIKEIDTVKLNEPIVNDLLPKTIAAGNIVVEETKIIEDEKPKKSPLSLKDNADVLMLIDQIFALIIRLYLQNKIETDEVIKAKKDMMISTLLGLVKILSLSNDNHKTIFEIVILY